MSAQGKSVERKVQVLRLLWPLVPKIANEVMVRRQVRNPKPQAEEIKMKQSAYALGSDMKL